MSQSCEERLTLKKLGEFFNEKPPKSNLAIEQFVSRDDELTKALFTRYANYFVFFDVEKMPPIFLTFCLALEYFTNYVECFC